MFKDIPMAFARRQKSAQAERSGEMPGEAGRESGSDEANAPRHGTGNTGSALLMAVLTRENLLQAFNRVRADKGAAGVDGRDIDQTARQLITRLWRYLGRRDCRVAKALLAMTIGKQVPQDGFTSPHDTQP